MPCNHVGEYQTCDTFHECVGCGESLMGFFTRGYCLSCWHIASTARANAIDEAIAACNDTVKLNRECAADSSDERSKYAYECYAMGADQSVAALEALKQKGN